MPDQACPCCQWDVSIPEHAEVIYSCPQCGQCLTVPPPWSTASIPNCDTRSLLKNQIPRTKNQILPAKLEFGSSNSGFSSGLIPPVLSYRRPPRLHNFGRNIFLGVTGLILGVFCTIMTLCLNCLARSTLQRLIFFVIDLMMIYCAGFMLMNALRRRRRRATARAFPVPDPVPMELSGLGTPVAVHQVNRSSLWGSILLGAFMLVAGLGVLALAWRGEINDARWYVVAVCGPIAGVSFIVKSCRSSGLRILVLTDGLISWQAGRAEAWPWDQIVAIWLKYELLAKDLEGYTYTLVRQDGERLNFHANLEFYENQLGVRAQYELCVRLLTKLRADLENGRELEFGPLLVSAQGIRRGMEVWAREDLEDIRVDKSNLIIRRTEPLKTISVPLQSIPNPAAFLLLTGF